MEKLSNFHIAVDSLAIYSYLFDISVKTFASDKRLVFAVLPIIFALIPMLGQLITLLAALSELSAHWILWKFLVSNVVRSFSIFFLRYENRVNDIFYHKYTFVAATYACGETAALGDRFCGAIFNAVKGVTETTDTAVLCSKLIHDYTFY